MKKRKSKRLLTLLLSAAMFLGSVPTSVFAESESTVDNQTVIEMTDLESQGGNIEESLEDEAKTEDSNDQSVSEEAIESEEQKNEHIISEDKSTDEEVEEVSNEEVEEVSNIDTKLSEVYEYVLDTNGVDSGSEYLIVSGNQALVNNNGVVSKADVTISGSKATISSTDLSKSLWTITKGNNNYTVNNSYDGTTRYLDLGNSSSLIITNSQNIDISSEGSGSYKISRRNRSTYYLTYSNNNFTSTINKSSIKLYKKTKTNQLTDKYEEYISFPVTMYNYEKSQINANSQFKFGKPNESNNPYNNINQFHNASVTQGILQSELGDDGLPQFINNIDSGKVFSKVDDEDNGRKVYDGVKFPFSYDSTTGDYDFDSSKHHTHIQLNDDKTLSSNQMHLYSGEQTIDGKTQFFPFNNHEDSSPDYYFGMNLGVRFYMTKDGKIDVNGQKQDIKFEFSGDDDVWVFIDGKLVLDLGGIHTEASGSINFASETITYNNARLDIKGNSINSNTTSTVELDKIHNGQVSLASLSDGEEHNLQVFYLERGDGVSNCRIKFNLPQQEVLEVEKILGTSTPTTSSDFKFKIEYKANIDDEYASYAGKKYTLYDGTSKVETTTQPQTSTDGTFTLKKNYIARFIDPDPGYYRIIETDTNGYTAKWSVIKQSGTTSTNLGSSNTNIMEGIKVDQPSNDSTNKNIITYTATCTNSGGLGLNPDVVVLDYGKPVKINVLENDNLPQGSGASLSGLLSTEGVTTDIVSLDNGNIQAKTANQNVEYTPTKFMDSIDTIKYNVTYNTDDETGTASQQADIKIIPATTVYYEDNFGDGSLNNDGTTNGIVFAAGNWGTASDEGYSSSGKEYQDSAQGPNATYGNDSSYSNDTGFSYGSSHVVTAENDSPALAKFTFKGTGFDIISRTDNNTGHMNVKVYNSKNELVKNLPVNTVYETTGGVLYQIPVISVTDLPYDTYRVMLTVTASTSNGISKPSTVYIDAIRLYNPIYPSGVDAEQANSAYKTDKEVNTVVNELRNLILRKADLNGSTTLPGIVYVDKVGNTSSVADYKGDGPNNELYLSKGSSIAFTLKTASIPASVKIGLKAPTGSSEVTIISNDQSSDPIPLSSATDMYYDITSKIKYNESNESQILIRNTGDSDTIVSITNFKLTYDNTPTIKPELVSNKELADYAVSLNNSINNVEDNDDTTGDEEENTNKPGNNKPGTNKPGNNKPGTNKPGTNKPGNNKPGTNKPGNNKPGTNKPGTNKPGNNKPGTNKPGNNKPSTNKPSTNKPSTSNPAVNKPSSSNTIGKFEETVQVDSSLDSLNKENIFVRIFDSIKNFVLAINSMIA